jgi:hypothetical protein
VERALRRWRAATMFIPTWFICGVGKRGRGGSPRPDDAIGFVPVAITGESSVARPMASDDGMWPVIEVVLRNGRVLRLSERAAPARAALLADALEGSGR